MGSKSNLTLWNNWIRNIKINSRPCILPHGMMQLLFNLKNYFPWFMIVVKCPYILNSILLCGLTTKFNVLNTELGKPCYVILQIA